MRKKAQKIPVYVYYLTRESRIIPIKKDPFMPTKRNKKINKKDEVGEHGKKRIGKKEQKEK